MHLLENLKTHAETERITAVDEGGELSYQSLYERSDAVAAYLNERVDGKSPVVIIGDKQNDILSCIFGALKGGHPYVFVPAHYPQKRVSDIIEDCGAGTVICFDGSLSAEHPEFVDASSAEAFARAFEGFAGRSVPVEGYASDDDLWALFYTSGSTGVPKGVELTGESIRAKVEAIRPLYEKYFTDGAIDTLNQSSYAFSISIPMLFYWVALRGATLHAVSRGMQGSYQELFDYMLAVNPHFMTATPSFVELCLKNPKFTGEHFTRCRYLGFGGEALPRTLFEALRECFPKTDISNGYGATETAAAPLLVVLDDDAMLEGSEVMPVGYDDGALGNLRIVDEAGNDLPDGEVGELFVEGGYVARGYHLLPEQTARAFYKAPDGTRGYRTGDLMFRKNGYLYYCGRKDNLVKVGGNRVELEDVEFNLRKVDIVRSCAVVPVMRGAQVVMLAAYVVLADDGRTRIASIRHIKRELSGMVQGYMVPQRIVIVDDLPRNNSGKVDRAKLKQEAAR